MNKRIDGLHNSLNQKIDTLQSSITSLLINNRCRSKGDSFPKHCPILGGVHELSYASELAPKMDEVKAIITLRSGKEIEQPVPKPVGETKEEEEVDPEHIIIKEDSMKKSMPPPFPQALRGKKKASKQAGILEVLR